MKDNPGSPPVSDDPGSIQPGDVYHLSGDFRNAVINIKSTIIGAEEVRDIESLPPEPGVSPYHGLQYFTEQDAGQFFGRELLTAKVINHLARARFLTIIGASGSGKSSLVRAGVIPALKSGTTLADGSIPPANSARWAIKVLTPSAHPLMGLAAVLTEDSDTLTKLVQDMQANKSALSVAARSLLAKNTNPELLLVVDQFEEVFTLCHEEDERRAFVDNLLAAAGNGDEQPIRIILVMRADFYANLAPYNPLRELVSTQQEFIGSMSREELSRAIIMPAAQGNWKIQEGLVELMLNDTGDEPGSLPLLSHALLETWNHRRGRTMTLSAYQESGGVRGAIAKTADQIFRQRLTPEQQAIARLIFLRLVDIQSDAPDTRRRTAFSELVTRASDPVTINAVLSILTDARLVTTGIQEPGDVKVVEVAHEALIREWPTLRTWLEDNRAGLILHRQLTEATNEWLHLNRDTGALYRGTRLKQILTWAEQNANDVSVDEQAFLDASRQVEKEEEDRDRQLKRTRLLRKVLFPILGVATIGILILVFYVSGLYVHFLTPAKMNGIFNIAVAEIGQMEPDGTSKTIPQNGGRLVSGWIANQLKSQLKDDPNLLVWQDSPEILRLNVTIGRVDGSTPEELNAAAQAMAARLNAQMVVFGAIDTRQTPARLDLEFWIDPQSGNELTGLQGYYRVATPIDVVNPAHPGIELQPEINAQASAMAWLALGLSHQHFGQSSQALDAFRKAAEFSPESPAVQFFIGRESLFLSDQDPSRQEALTASAQEAFQKAIDLNSQYANAYVGMGSVYFAQAKRIVEAVAEKNPPDSAIQLATAANFIGKARDSYALVLGLPANTKPPGQPIDLTARLGDGTSLRLLGEIEYHLGQFAQGKNDLEQAARELEGIAPQFKGDTQERFLAQTYQTLATAYQWLGFLAETAGNTPNRQAEYNRALQYYDSCIALGQKSPDKIVRDDIAAKLCAPYRKDLQQHVDNLSGGS